MDAGANEEEQGVVGGGQAVVDEGVVAEDLLFCEDCYICIKYVAFFIPFLILPPLRMRTQTVEKA